jgi:hypothetical protein
VSKILLTDLFPLRAEVELVQEKPKIPIRPLPLETIVLLLANYKDGMLALYNESQKDNPQYEALLVALPELVADVICAGADDLKDQRESVMLLPPGPKLQLLAAIWELSVPDPKKLIESLSRLMAQARRLVETQQRAIPEQPTSPTDTSDSPT